MGTEAERRIGGGAIDRAAPDHSRFPTSCTIALIAASVSSMLVPPLWQGIAAKELVFSLLAIACGVAALPLVRADRPEPGRDRAQLGFVVLTIAALLAVRDARFADAAFAALPPYAAMAALHFGAARVLRDVRAATLLAGVQVAAGVVVATVGLFGYRAFLVERAESSLGESARAAFLATPFFEHGYLAAQVIAPLVAIAIALAITSGSTKRRAALFFAIVILVGFVLATASRAASLATLVGGLVAILAARRAHPRSSLATRRVKAIAVVAAVASLVAVAIMRPELGARFASWLDPDAAYSNFQRLLLWSDTLRLIADAPWTGVGPGHYGFTIGHYHVAARPLPHAHDQALHTLSEIGILGFLGLVLVLGSTLARTRSTSRSKAREPARLALRAGYLGALASWLVFAISETPLAFPGGAATFAIACGAIAAARADEDSDPAATSRSVAWPMIVAAIAIAVAIVPSFRAARAGFLAGFAEDAMERGVHAAARDALIAAAAETSAIPEIHAIRARLEADAGNAEAALAAWSRHDLLTPGLPYSLIHVASLEMQSGRPERAIAPLSLARRRAPLESRIDLEIELATALHRAHRFESARLAWVRLLSRHAQVERPIVLLRMAETLLNLGRDRATAIALLLAYEQAIPESERAYPRKLRTSIDEWYSR